MLDLQDRRKHPRAYFQRHELQGIFVFPDFVHFAFAAQILDISQGGLHFILRREDHNAIEEASKLILVKITSGKLTVYNSPILVTISRVMHPHFNTSLNFCVSIGGFFNAPIIWEKQDALHNIVSQKMGHQFSHKAQIETKTVDSPFVR